MVDEFKKFPSLSIIEDAPITKLRISLRKHDAQVPSATVIGPLLNHQDLLSPIHEFLYEQFENKQSYMLDEPQQALERQLAVHERSAYFVAKRHGVIVGVLRLCPAPFEFQSLLSLDDKTWPDFSLHVEISRLVVSKKEARTSTSMLLVIEACIWAMSQGYAGIVALCRPTTRIIFERYGLAPVFPELFSIPMRNNQQ
ncbi:MAG: hypothetical protein EOP06_30205, partial [Proteobacteria bacterium]